MLRTAEMLRIAATGLALVAAAPAQAAHFGDAERGAKVFGKCKGCHQIGEGARNKIGPHLNFVFGRKAASIEGFSYSRSFNRAAADGLVWSADNLEIFLENPKAMASGARMSFRGVKNHDDLADLMAFLRQFSDNPSNIPGAEPTATPRDPDVAPAILALQGDPEFGAYLAGECTTCHQIDGGDEGIPSITLWPVEDFVTALHAYKNKYRPHPVMQLVAGRLSEEEIAALAAYFKDPK